MNPAGESHQITPEFRAHLEWQVASAMRRETRFAEPTGGRPSRLHVALVAVVALFIGGIAVAASGELQESKQRDLLMATANQEEALVRMRVELARADLQETQRRFEVGTSDRQTLQAAQRQLRAMEMELQRIRLDMEEIQQTSAAPRNDLQAPLVGKRDFVRERLRLQLDTAERGAGFGRGGRRASQAACQRRHCADDGTTAGRRGAGGGTRPSAGAAHRD